MFEGWPQVNEGLVALGIAVVGVIAWFSRLEANIATNTRDLERLEKQQDNHEEKLTELDNRVMDKLLSIEKAVSRIEGKLTQ